MLILILRNYRERDSLKLDKQIFLPSQNERRGEGKLVTLESVLNEYVPLLRRSQNLLIAIGQWDVAIVLIYMLLDRRQCHCRGKNLRKYSPHNQIDNKNIHMSLIKIHEARYNHYTKQTCSPHNNSSQFSGRKKVSCCLTFSSSDTSEYVEGIDSLENTNCGGMFISASFSVFLFSFASDGDSFPEDTRPP